MESVPTYALIINAITILKMSSLLFGNQQYLPLTRNSEIAMALYIYVHIRGVQGSFSSDPNSVDCFGFKIVSDSLNAYHLDLGSAATSDAAFQYGMAFSIYSSNKEGVGCHVT